MKSSPAFCAAIYSFLLLAVGALPVEAVPGAVKLPPRPASGQTNALHGFTVAVNDLYAVAGEPLSNQRISTGGAVHVYSAKSGKFLRSLLPADLADGQRFGSVLALHGHLLAVGCGSTTAALRPVYLFDLRRGKLLRKLAPQSQPISPAFGSSLALNNEAVFAGTTDDNSDRGAVFVFSITNGGELAKLTSAGSSPGDQLGTSLALAGDILFAGAPEATSASGVIVLFNWRQNMEVKQLFQTPVNPGSRMGYSLAVAGDMLYAGAPAMLSDAGGILAHNWVQGGYVLFPAPPGRKFFGYALAAERGLLAVGEFAANTDPGTVTLLNGATGAVLATLTGEQPGDRCAASVALFGGRLLFGAPNHDLPPGLLPNSGAVYLIEAPTARDLPLTLLMATQSPAIGGGVFRGIGNAFINNAGKPIITATLSATTPPSANVGVYAELASPDLIGRKGFNVNGNAVGTDPRITQLDMALMNRDGHALVRAIFPGGHAGIYKGAGGGILASLLPPNTGLPVFAGARISKLLDIAQSAFIPIMLGDPGSFAVRYRLANLAGVGGVQKNNDSGVLIASSGVFLGPVAPILVSNTREGQSGPPGTGLLELGNRLAYNSKHAAFTTQVSGLSSKPSTAVVRVNAETSTQTLAAFSGQAAPGTMGDFFRGFHGVTVEGGLFVDPVIWRASLTGANVNAQNNEGLWHETHGLRLRKGDQVPTETVAPRVWNRVLGVWPAGGLGRIIVLARIKGAGVNASNDIGLWLLDDDGIVKLLLKEGQRLALPDAPRIGVINRVDARPTGRYTVLVTLSGAAASRNQLLLTGDVSAGTTFPERVAVIPAQPVLRKGERFTHSFTGAAPVSIRSLTLSQVLDPGGMGGTGKGQVVDAAGNVAVKLRISNRDLLFRGSP